jgi:hypothetical protein
MGERMRAHARGSAVSATPMRQPLGSGNAADVTGGGRSAASATPGASAACRGAGPAPVTGGCDAQRRGGGISGRADARPPATNG